MPPRFLALVKRRQKNDRRDAEHILDLILKGEFPNLHRMSEKNQEIVRLLRHRQKLVKHSVMIKNSLQRILIETGLIFKAPLSSQKAKQKFRDLKLPVLLASERDRWLELLIEIEKQISGLEQKLKAEAQADERVQRLLTIPESDC